MKRWKTAVIVVTAVLVLVGALGLGCRREAAEVPTRTVTMDGKPIVGLSCRVVNCPDCPHVTVDLPGGPEVAPVTLTRPRGLEAPPGPATVYGHLLVRRHGSWPLGSYTGVEPAGGKLTLTIAGPEPRQVLYSEYRATLMEGGRSERVTCYAYGAD
ncbi:MAG: hypothetical protein IT370_04050 [Deltaproteobacteria bacterium]|nr:hypothetical protein [Deltaproteobacteria bacterium]